MESKSPNSSRDQAHRSYRRYRPTIIVILALLMAIVALILLLTPSGAPGGSAEVTYSTAIPSEEKPDKNYKWQGTPNDPKRLTIKSLGIDGYVQKVGVDQNKEVAVPDNIHIAGWFTESVKPGQKGLSIIDGHVDGKTQDGIFVDLAKIKPGAEVKIEFGDGSSKAFRVMVVEEVEEEKAASVLFSQNPKATNQLNLITCSGDFNKSTKRYEKRVIVSTELVPQT